MNMPEFLSAPFVNGPQVTPLDVLIRLLAALVLGGVVAWIYRHTSRRADVSSSFAVTLVLLSVLIAIVTQVIGDNVARAFSLVGALSIVRFRTVVRDTQDTAYVIFAVVIGMAVGAKNLWVAGIGLGVGGLAAYLMMLRANSLPPTLAPVVLSVRVGLGHELETLLGKILDAHVRERELMSVSTAKQGIALDVIYHARLCPTGAVHELVTALNRVEGVQSVSVQRRGFDED
ncbi:MAG: DUF4956 domain-containing protein [Verrucomicrobia bacterium]|nr:DUF4956 domain-containing protein [Verrucomicrobiota bacterium]